MINQNETTYLSMLKTVRDHGNRRTDRTGTGTIGLFGLQTRYDLRAGFPILTTKKMDLNSVLSELLWFLEGSTDERRLAELRYGKDRSLLEDRKTIWTQNARDPKWLAKGRAVGDLGRVYGAQWTDWRSPGGLSNDPEKALVLSLNQIDQLIHGLKNDPYGRRHVVTAWNPGEMDDMALPPCHVLFQCYVQDNALSLQWYQRSVDKLLGEPYNIVSYALLTHMLAQICGYEPHELIHCQGDTHIYLDHLEAVDTQLSRNPYFPARLVMDRSVKSIYDFRLGSFELSGYEHHPAIYAPMAV